MLTGKLPKRSMDWADDLYLFQGVDVLYLGIVVPVPMDDPRHFYKAGFTCAKFDSAKDFSTCRTTLTDKMLFRADRHKAMGRTPYGDGSLVATQKDRATVVVLVAVNLLCLGDVSLGHGVRQMLWCYLCI